MLDVKTILRLAVKARGVSKVAAFVGLSREGLSRMLAPTGNPRFRNVWKIARVLGLRLIVVPVEKSDAK